MQYCPIKRIQGQVKGPKEVFGVEFRESQKQNFLANFFFIFKEGRFVPDRTFPTNFLSMFNLIAAMQMLCLCGIGIILI